MTRELATRARAKIVQRAPSGSGRSSRAVMPSAPAATMRTASLTSCALPSADQSTAATGAQSASRGAPPS